MYQPQICLYQPEIPQNTGNIGRLAAATKSHLHLVKPLGFSLENRYLKRAGLDYWPYLNLEVHEDFSPLRGFKCAFLSKHATKLYTDIPKDTQLLVFGRESSGLPANWREQYPEDFYNIPMFHPGVRSLNLANAVAIVLYDMLRKNSHSVGTD